MEGEQKDYDIPEKELEDYPDVFADIINALVCQGDEIVKPENLRSATVETRYLGFDGKLKRQTEDLAKYEVSAGEANVLFLLANQTAPDDRMILRKCSYTGGYYRGQYNWQSEDVCPVVELVLYWGEKRWGGKRSIRGLFQGKNLPEGFWRYIDNEKLHVFEMRHLPGKTIKRFTSDMRIVLEALSDTPNGECFNWRIKHPWALRELLVVLLGENRYRELKKGFPQDNDAKEPYGIGKGACNMRNWLGEAWDKGIEQGKMEGKAEGIIQGLAKGIEAMVSLFHEFGMTFEETEAKLKEKFDLADEEVERDMKLYW